MTFTDITITWPDDVIQNGSRDFAKSRDMFSIIHNTCVNAIIHSYIIIAQLISMQLRLMFAWAQIQFDFDICSNMFKLYNAIYQQIYPNFA